MKIAQQVPLKFDFRLHEVKIYMREFPTYTDFYFSSRDSHLEFLLFLFYADSSFFLRYILFYWLICSAFFFPIYLIKMVWFHSLIPEKKKKLLNFLCFTLSKWNRKMKHKKCLWQKYKLNWSSKILISLILAFFPLKSKWQFIYFISLIHMFYRAKI